MGGPEGGLPGAKMVPLGVSDGPSLTHTITLPQKVEVSTWCLQIRHTNLTLPPYLPLPRAQNPPSPSDTGADSKIHTF